MNYFKLLTVFLVVLFISSCTDVTFDNALDLRGTNEFTPEDSLLARPWPPDDPDAIACRFNPDCPDYIKDTIGPVITIFGPNPANIPYGDPQNILATLRTQVEAFDEFENKKYTSDLISARDNVAVFSEGTYEIHYEVTDESGNPATASRTVIVLPEDIPEENTKPVIFVKYVGDNISIFQGDEFIVSNYFGANDKEDKDLGDDDLVVTGQYNTNDTGTYNLTVSVTDSQGATSSRQFTLVVKKRETKNNPPVLTLKPPLKMELDFFDDFVEPGWDVEDPDGDDVTVDTSIQDLGKTVYIIYQAEDEHGAKSERLSREISLRTDDPVIIVDSDDTIRIFVGDDFEPPDATAYDGDGNPISNIQITNEVNTRAEGTYKVEYYVIDTKGRYAKKIITVMVRTKDREPPEITILGNKDTTITLGDPYTRPEATAYDEYEGKDLTDSVVVSGTVNTDSAATYLIIYTVSDSTGNVAKDTVKVKVKAPTEYFLDKYGVPLPNALPMAQGTYTISDIDYSDDENTVNLNSVQSLNISWEPGQYGGMHQFGLQISNQYKDYSGTLKHNFNSSEPSFTLSGTPVEALNQEFYINVIDGDVVWVAVDGSFAIIWSK
ncbi:MAG TPA: DUF5011 domain-containing protein [Chitinispirillaceae bacterium]|nr:DUF5011 domain-containing protein [Chitinispirillaceae bacterium]